MNEFRMKIQKIPRSRFGKTSFLYHLKKGARILDVGCGNNSPRNTKFFRSDIYYTGIDVGDYNQDQGSLDYADKYIVSTAQNFSKMISEIEEEFDAVISSHNLEHCNKPMETLTAMCKKLRGGGDLYLSFPGERSINFPHREGTLNFYDDPTHVYLPNYNDVLKLLKNNGLEIRVAKKQYRPIYYFLLGCMTEYLSRRRKKVMHGTWAFWGFETVIWARKK